MTTNAGAQFVIASERLAKLQADIHTIETQGLSSGGLNRKVSQRVFDYVNKLAHPDHSSVDNSNDDGTVHSSRPFASKASVKRSSMDHSAAAMNMSSTSGHEKEGHSREAPSLANFFRRLCSTRSLHDSAVSGITMETNLAACSSMNESFEFLARRPVARRQSITVLPTQGIIREEETSYCDEAKCTTTNKTTGDAREGYYKAQSRRRSTLPPNFGRDNSLLLSDLFGSTKSLESNDEEEEDGDDVLADDLQEIEDEVHRRKSRTPSLFPPLNGSSVATVDLSSSVREYVDGLCILAPNHRSSFKKQLHLPRKDPEDEIATKGDAKLLESWHRSDERLQRNTTTKPSSTKLETVGRSSPKHERTEKRGEETCHLV